MVTNADSIELSVHTQDQDYISAVSFLERLSLRQKDHADNDRLTERHLSG